MTQRATVFCSSCGVENPIASRYCSACGAVMGTVPSVPPQEQPASAEPPQAAPAPAVAREGLVAAGRQRFAYTALAICSVLGVLVTFMGFGTFGLEWGKQGGGLITTIARPAPGYIVGIFLIIALNPVFFRLVAPRRADVGMAAFRRYRRTLRERDGIRLLLNPGSLRAGVIVLSLVWIGIGAMPIYNLGSLRDQGFDVAVGLYAAMAVPILGLITTLAMWPGGAEIVYMDRQGVITRG
jgi:hypothetical protein